MTLALGVDNMPQMLQVSNDQLKSLCELKSCGISGSDSSAYDEFRRYIQFVDGMYEVELPKKEGHPALPGNYHLCVRRMQGLIILLQQDPAILQKYHLTFMDQI